MTAEKVGWGQDGGWLQVGVSHLLLLAGQLCQGHLEFLQQNGQKSHQQIISMEFCEFERKNFLFFFRAAEKSAFTAPKMARAITAFYSASLIIGQSISPQTSMWYEQNRKTRINSPSMKNRATTAFNCVLKESGYNYIVKPHLIPRFENSYLDQALHAGQLQVRQRVLSGCRTDQNVPGQVEESFSYWEFFNTETKINKCLRLLSLHIDI